jgi:hypothetical protein
LAETTASRRMEQRSQTAAVLDLRVSSRMESSECSGRRASSTIEAVAVPAPATARRGRGPVRMRLGGSRRPARLRAVNHGPRHRRTPSELYGGEMVAKAIVGSPMRRSRTSPRDPAFTNQRLRNQKPEGAGAREGPGPSCRALLRRWALDSDRRPFDGFEQIKRGGQQYRPRKRSLVRGDRPLAVGRFPLATPRRPCCRSGDDAAHDRLAACAA